MNESRLTTLLGKFPSLHILVVGDFFLDKYLSLEPTLTEISLETGLEAYQVVEIRPSPGAAGTVCANLRALGAKVSALGVIGQDGKAFELGRGLAERGVAIDSLITQPDLFTPTYTKPMMREPDGRQHELQRNAYLLSCVHTDSGTAGDRLRKGECPRAFTANGPARIVDDDELLVHAFARQEVVPFLSKRIRPPGDVGQERLIVTDQGFGRGPRDPITALVAQAPGYVTSVHKVDAESRSLERVPVHLERFPAFVNAFAQRPEAVVIPRIEGRYAPSAESTPVLGDKLCPNGFNSIAAVAAGLASHHAIGIVPTIEKLSCPPLSGFKA